MKIVITGGCGFLGSNIAHAMLNNNHDVIIIDNFYRFGSGRNHQWLVSQGTSFKFHKADVRSLCEIEEIIKKEQPDVLLHFAGQVAMTTSIANPFMDFEINVKGTLNILESIRKHSLNTIMGFSSTNKVYGDLEYITYRELEKRYEAVGYEKGFDENLRLEFHSPYGCSKGAADQYILDYSRIFGLRTFVFRHSSIFGDRQFATEDQGWIGWFCQKAYEIAYNITKEPFSISGNGKQVRDILFSQDLIRCYELAIQNIDKVKGNVFNIGGGYQNSFSLLELFEYLEEKLGIEMKYYQLPWRASDQKVFIADISKAQNTFGWTPKINKFQGVDKMYDWVVSTNQNKEK